MKFKQLFYLLPACMVLFQSCSEDENLGEDFEPQTYNVSGKVEKGPFISGSTITIQPMNEKLQVLGSLYTTTIQDDMGNFSFGSKMFEAPYAELTANGYFFNEVNGNLSAGTLNLLALIDLSSAETVNVNILTHLKYRRIQKLISEGMDFTGANQQAQKELFTLFGLQEYAEKDASTFSIIDGTDESGTLIAISALLLIDRSEAALTEYLAKLCREFGEKGQFEESTLAQINEDKKNLVHKLSDVQKNIIERYQGLGLTVEVKELTRFFDWDNDGIAGNETLKDGETVTLETTELTVPNEGGTYKIKITSPIPVYLTSQVNDEDTPVVILPEESFFTELYDNVGNADITIEKKLEANELTIQIGKLNSRTPKNTSVLLYDCIGNTLGEVKIQQEGNNDTSIPNLGETSKKVVNAIAMNLANAFGNLNLIEQYYHYNKETKAVNQYIKSNSNTIYNIWNDFYEANRMILSIKDADSEQLGVYQTYLNVFNALHYYYMVVAWGDIPYIDNYNNSEAFSIARTPQNEIFKNLESNLEQAIEYLEEKRNESLSKNINDFFFLSKDVARVLLADISMYQGEYRKAEELLGKVIDNSFYRLDNSNYNHQETIDNLLNNGSSSETIFALEPNNTTRGNITIATPPIIPLMTYTDVILSYAECLYKNGKTSEAESALEQVLTTKGLTLTANNTLDRIIETRLQTTLYCNVNFAFLKRIGQAVQTYGIWDFQQLLPIPINELLVNPMITQNPGY